MNTDFVSVLASQLATKLNSLINIPFVSEKDEQAFFEVMVNIVLGAVVTNLDKLSDLKANKQ